MRMSSTVPSKPRSSPADSLTPKDWDSILRAIDKASDRHPGVTAEDTLRAAPAILAARRSAGGKRTGAGRPGQDWVLASGGHSLPELSLRIVIERAASQYRRGTAPSFREVFDTLLPPISGSTSADAQAKRFAAFQHAIKCPSKFALKQAAERRAARRAGRLDA